MKKQNITPRNNKNQAHGLWIMYGNHDNLWYKGHYINNVQYGHWIDNWVNKHQIIFLIK